MNILKSLKNSLDHWTEFKNVIVSFIVIYLFLQIIYYKDFNGAFVYAFGITYLFIFPGYSFFLANKMNELLKLVISFGLGMGLLGLGVYYLNVLFNIPVVPYYKIYPLIFAFIGLFVSGKHGNQHENRKTRRRTPRRS